MRTPTRYALWSMLAIAPAFLLIAAFAGSRPLNEPLGPLTGLMSVIATAIALGVSALVAPGIVDPRNSEPPGWAILGVFAAFAQIATAMAIGFDGPATVWTGAYLPAALVCLNILALILIHVWVAAAGMGYSPAVGLATGAACGAWVFRFGSAQGFDAFVVVSYAAVAMAFIAATVAVFRDRSSLAPVPDAP